MSLINNKAKEQAKSQRIEKAGLADDLSVNTQGVQGSPKDFQALSEDIQNLDKEDTTNFVKNGSVGIIDIITPSAVDTRLADCIIVDGMFISTILIISYPYERTSGWLADLINYDEGVEVNVFYQPLDKAKIIKELTYMIGTTKAKRKNIGENQSDVDIIDTSIGHAQYMRAQMQLENEDPYYLYIVVSVYADSKQKLDEKLLAVESKIGAMDIISRRADYRHENGFLSCLPIHMFSDDLKNSTARNALTSGIASTYPFVSSEFCDNDGVFVGINEHNRSLVIVDIFNTALYKNANMVVLGTSGAGKTFLLQLLAMRNRLQGVNVMIIAPLKGHEFKNSCLSIGGQFIRISPGSNDCINIMEIRRCSVDVDIEGGGTFDENGSNSTSLMLSKIQKLHIFFSLVFPEMTVEEKQYLDDKLMMVYRTKGIDIANDSVCLPEDMHLPFEERRFKEMPVLGDLYELMKDDPKTERLALILKRLVSGSLKSFNQHTNVDLTNKYTVADISELKDDLLPIGMFIVVDLFWDKIKEDRTQKKVIIVDEAWNLIGSTGNKQTAGFVLEIFKIIRGYGGSAIAATQDVNDFMALEGGKYGKGIINNAKMKIVLQLEEEDAESLKKILKLSEEEMAKVTTFKRGHGLFYAGSNRIAIEFQSSPEERELITTDRKELEDIKKRREAQKIEDMQEDDEFDDEFDEDDEDDFDEAEFLNL